MAVAQASPKVAIVVPVYNPGPYLERCVASVLAQTMPPGELEAVFVDDGSTDGSGATLDALAATHPHIRVIHEPNSGWAGRPRNVGLEAARADYVLFLDHDDRLGSEAAARMYERAVSDGSDVVLGRSIGHGRPNGSQRSWRTRGPVRFVDDPDLVQHLKPHKLVRRQFLLDHDIRFPEGKRRLEDQAFVLEAYFQADAISVVGDYVCYHHHRRSDSGNAVSTPWEPAFYYKYVREDLDIIERHTSPGAFRNRLIGRFIGVELITRLSGPKFLSATPERREALLAEIRSILADYVPVELDERLSPPLRAVTTLARADRLDLLVALAEAESQASPSATATGIAWRDGEGLALELDVALRRVPDGVAIAPDRPDGWVLRVPARVAAAVPAEQLHSQAPIQGVVDVLAIDADAVSTSLDATVSFERATSSTDADAWHLRVRTVLPLTLAVAGKKRKARELRFQVRIRVTPRRQRADVVVAPGVTMSPLTYHPGRDGDGRPRLKLTPARLAGGQLILTVAPDALSYRLRRTAAHLRDRVRRRARRLVGRRR